MSDHDLLLFFNTFMYQIKIAFIIKIFPKNIILRGEGQTFFRAFINSELGPPEVALTQN